jgi:nicotinamide-nucleotide amidase
VAEPPSRTETPPGGLPIVPPENEVIEELVAAGWTVAVAESLTGGMVAARLSACPGTEAKMLGGVVTYDTSAKRRVLAVEGDVVTDSAARQMASAVKELFGADVGVGLTGVAGPARQEDQPVGTVFVGWSLPDGEGSQQLSCAGAPEQIRHGAATQALVLLRDAVRRARPA